MPNRYIRASAIESEPVNALTPQAEVFYRRLLNRADDFGRFTANLRLLRSSLFPLQLDYVTERIVAHCLAECVAVGLVFTYEADGKPLLVINKWEQGRAKHSDFAPPPADVCDRMKTYVYTCKHMLAYAPDSDTDSDSGSVSGSDKERPAKPAEPAAPSLALSSEPVSRKKVAAKDATQLRVERLMRRRESTPLSANEAKAYKAALPAILATQEADWVALEAFYAAPQSETFARKDLPQLLNNWNGELDKARNWKPKSGDEFGSVRTSGWGTEIHVDRSKPVDPDEPLPFG
jgi:hypothetical protein